VTQRDGVQSSGRGTHRLLLCFESAPEGGETLLTRNADLTVSVDLQRLVRAHGGIAYRREYYDAAADVAPNPMQKVMGTWQSKTGTEDRGEAAKFFTDIGFNNEEVSFDDDGTLVVQNVRSGFVDRTGSPSSARACASSPTASRCHRRCFNG